MKGINPRLYVQGKPAGRPSLGAKGFRSLRGAEVRGRIDGKKLLGLNSGAKKVGGEWIET